MKKKIKATELERIDINVGYIKPIMFDDSVDNRKINNVLGRNVNETYKESKIVLKNKIIKALEECDDFEIDFSNCERFGDECELITYKIEVESDKELHARKRKAKRASAKSKKKRKELQELKDREDYEKLKKKFEQTS